MEIEDFDAHCGHSLVMKPIIRAMRQQGPVPPTGDASMKDDLGKLPKIHPRMMIVQVAEAELHAFIDDWQKRHGLTPAESARVIASRIVVDMGDCVQRERMANETEMPR